MLIVSNGAFKSGSTWLYNLLREMTQYPAPPAQFLNPEWKNPSIDSAQLPALLATLTPQTQYLVKNHFGTPQERELLLSHPLVRVFDIERDLRDVVVSAYYHVRRKENYTGDFETYYHTMGRKTIRDVMRYHDVWAVDSPQIYVASYERLHEDFAGELQKMAAFLARDPLTADEITQIYNLTTLHNLRTRYGEENAPNPFFRKGIVGDWKNYFTDAITADYATLINPPALTLFDRIKSQLNRLKFT